MYSLQGALRARREAEVLIGRHDDDAAVDEDVRSN